MKTYKLSNGVEIRADCMGKEIKSRYTKTADEVRKDNKKYRQKNAEQSKNSN